MKTKGTRHSSEREGQRWEFGRWRFSHRGNVARRVSRSGEATVRQKPLLVDHDGAKAGELLRDHRAELEPTKKGKKRSAYTHRRLDKHLERSTVSSQDGRARKADFFEFQNLSQEEAQRCLPFTVFTCLWTSTSTGVRRQSRSRSVGRRHMTES